jgi:hypothetical protein
MAVCLNHVPSRRRTSFLFTSRELNTHFQRKQQNGFENSCAVLIRTKIRRNFSRENTVLDSLHSRKRELVEFMSDPDNESHYHNENGNDSMRITRSIGRLAPRELLAESTHQNMQDVSQKVDPCWRCKVLKKSVCVMSLVRHERSLC